MRSLSILLGVGVLASGAFLIFVPQYTGTPSAAEEVGRPAQVLFHRQIQSASFQQAPVALAPAPEGGPAATSQYRNVQVLTDLRAAEFDRLQIALTAWVSPKEGCHFCHVDNDFASDAKPQKLAARVMLKMTRHLNTRWSSHVAGAGVTCYTCHRGQPVPSEIWFPSVPPPEHTFIGKQENWVEAADTVRKFFPDDSLAEYLYDDQPIAVQSSTALKSGTIASSIEAKRIYEVMMTMSDGIGANCGYCHNSRAFQSWAESTPYRWIGYDAIRLVRDVNRNYLFEVGQIVPQTRSLTNATQLPVIPPRELNPQLGNGFVTCATCHVGITKPLNGTNMVDAYPGLGGPASAIASIALLAHPERIVAAGGL